MFRRIAICLIAGIAFTSCVTTPIPAVATTQTEIATTAATLAGDIETFKEITDKAKITGEIDDVQTVIEYVDKSAEKVKTLNVLIKKHTSELAEQTKVIDTLRVEVAKYKPYRERFYILTGGILLLVLFCVALKFRKVVLPFIP